QSFGITPSILVAGSAALLVGVGFGLQHTFNDFISGLILLFDQSIEVGNVIQVGSLIGRVKQIGLRATTVESREAISVIVPNSKFTQENVINWSHGNELIRFDVKIGVAYGSPVELVMQSLVEAAKAHPQIAQQPAPCARFIDFGDSALLFELLFWTKDSFLVEFIKSDLRVAIDASFRTKDIKIPFPQRDLHIVSGSTSFPQS
ncbi:MAG: mechanosensitive ion channel domain-containing protein, partial [Bacteroidota bacterium]